MFPWQWGRRPKPTNIRGMSCWGRRRRALIGYEVTATTAGAKFFYNPIRKGSVASDESVFDAMSGEPLKFEVVSGVEAKKDPLMAKVDEGTDYIKVTLARPVPENGQGRVVIVKTYRDAKSYYVDGKTIVFNRPLGIKRNKVVLPAGTRWWGRRCRRRYGPRKTDGSRSALCMQGRVKAPWY